MGITGAFMVPHPPLIVPAVGRGGEAQIAETTAAYEQIAEEIAALSPETIVITSPHSIMYADYFHISPGRGAQGSFASFGAPEVSFRETYDEEFTSALSRLAEDRDILAGTRGERSPELDHGTMVPLYFIRQKYQSFRLVRIGLSGLPYPDHYALGMAIRDIAEKLNRNTVIVASGDLSHKLQSYGPYGYAAEGPEYDKRIMDTMGRAAFGELFAFDEHFCDKASECGHRSFVIMAGAFDGRNVRAKAYSHQDVTGVGYGICSFYPEDENENRRFLEQYLSRIQEKTKALREHSDPYVNLARASLESFIVKHQILPLPEGLPEEMLHTRAGAFVSIHKHGQLRGCIGTIAPAASCVANEIIANAISASTRDPRFDPIGPEELPYLEINVDVLGEPEPISSPDQLDVKRYGVIVTRGMRRGLLLPDLEGVDTVEEQIAIARQKAGIREGEPIELQRFEVIRHR